MAHTQDDERDIAQCELQRYEAMVQGDLAKLSAVLSEDLTYAHTTGVLDTKAQFIAALASGQLKYESITPEERTVRVYGAVGIVTGTARMGVKVRGQQASFRIRYTTVYIKLHDRWQMVAWQSTRLPER